MIIKVLAFLMPWPIKRFILQKWFKYQIHPHARIGFAWVYPGKLIMGADARIDHLTIAINLDVLYMENNSSIGRGNWITGFPKSSTKHFSHQANRESKLKLGEHSAITKNHHIDCTNLIEIGSYTTIAGYRSQLLTHSINTFENIQDSAPIIIGDYAFIGTNVVILGGSNLPSKSILAAKSLLNKSFTAEWTTYGGIPAKPLNTIPDTAGYFTRTVGFVY